MTHPSPRFRDRLAEALPASLQPVGAALRYPPEFGEPDPLTGYGHQILDALVPTVQALIADAEKRAAAQALRDAADGIRRRAAGMSFAPKVHAQHEARLLDRSATALDPAGAAEGAGR